MSNEELQALLDLEAKATPAPFAPTDANCVAINREVVGLDSCPHGARIIQRVAQTRAEAMETFFHAVAVGFWSEADEALRIALRNAAPSLLAELTSVRAALITQEHEIAQTLGMALYGDSNGLPSSGEHTASTLASEAAALLARLCRLDANLQKLTPLVQYPAWKRVKFRYTNWKGETAIREAYPQRLWYGKGEWHEGWLLEALDTEKGARTFAVADMDFLENVPC